MNARCVSHMPGQSQTIRVTIENRPSDPKEEFNWLIDQYQCECTVDWGKLAAIMYQENEGEEEVLNWFDLLISMCEQFNDKQQAFKDWNRIYFLAHLLGTDVRTLVYAMCMKCAIRMHIYDTEHSDA